MAREAQVHSTPVRKIKATLSDETWQRAKLLAAFYEVLLQDMAGAMLTRVIGDMWVAHVDRFKGDEHIDPELQAAFDDILTQAQKGETE